MRLALPTYISRRKDSLAFQLFTYLIAIIISILIVHSEAEQALLKVMLRVPNNVKLQMQALSRQVDTLIAEGNMNELANWEERQGFRLIVLNAKQQPLTGQAMPAHFQLRLQDTIAINSQLQARVSDLFISLPLTDGNSLLFELPQQFHPAADYRLHSLILKVMIIGAMLALFSRIMARHLQEPLDRLRDASNKLANGDFNVSVVQALKSNTIEFNELAQDFDHMSREVHSLAEKQRRLIRDVSHELRTPLARQNLILHLLRKRVNQQELALVSRLQEEQNEQNQLISEILEFSRLENARYASELRVNDLDALLLPQMERYKIDLRTGQSLSYKVDTLDCKVRCDNTLLLRSVNNLIGNAVKYSGDNAAIAVQISQLAVQTDHYLLLSVADNGPGIADNKLSDVFDPFTRLDPVRDKQSGGYGLGLAIVKEAMRMMGGKVIAENQPSGGLKVSLLFPR